MSRTRSFGAIALVLALAGDGRPEPTAEDKAAAESLFQDALKLIKLNTSLAIRKDAETFCA